MMKKMLNRGISASGAASDELKLSALLGSSYVDKIVEEQNVKLLAQRDRHASELKLLIAEELKLIPEFDKNVSKAQADVEEKFTALQAARGELGKLLSDRDNFMHRSLYKRQLHEKELRELAPFIDDAICELRDLMEQNQNIRISEAEVSKKRSDLRGPAQTIVILSDRNYAGEWRSNVAAAIRQLEGMKLEPDFAKFPERIAEILSSIRNPKSFPVDRITIDTGTGERKVEVDVQ